MCSCYVIDVAFDMCLMNGWMDGAERDLRLLHLGVFVLGFF